MTQQVQADAFPFTLDDLSAWVIKRKDHTMVRYSLKARQESRVTIIGSSPPSVAKPAPVVVSTGSLSKYCKHYPEKQPTYETPDGKVRLFMADAPGLRRDVDNFDIAIDCGHVLSAPKTRYTDLLRGDPALCKPLAKHELVDDTKYKARVLFIDWDDRQAPDLHPSFWPHLAKLLKGDVVIACQGGHGRSGSCCVSLMMAYTTYTPFEAITHLRAVHCARAIESIVQHDYLDWVGAHLGRDTDAKKAEAVKSFRDMFLSFSKAEAKPFQERLTAVPAEEEMKRDD